MAKRTVKRRYQGREFQTTLQANTKKELDVLIEDTRSMAERNGMEDFKVLKNRKDPDGGYKAIVVAHNLNPITWVKSKVGSSESKARAREELAEEKASKRRDYEEAKKLKEEVREVERLAERTERLRVARQTPKEKRLERLEAATQEKEYRDVRPTTGMKVKKAVTGLLRSGTESSTTKYGRGGRVQSRVVRTTTQRKPFLAVPRPRPSFDLSHLRMMPTTGMLLPIQRDVPVTSKQGLSKNQSEVYSAIKDGYKSTDQLAAITGLSKAQVVRTVKSLKSKRLL